MVRCNIIGISDNRKQWFHPEVMDIIASGRVFSGGIRHHEIMCNMLPKGAVWIDITVPLSDVFRQYEEYNEVVIFASGDPLFYGFASTVRRECPNAVIKVFPFFNSIQMLAHRMNIAYQDIRNVSLTGRQWDKFDETLIKGEELIGCLTDKNKTPHAIMQRMREYGYDHYKMTVGECLGNKEKERVSEYDENTVYANPNCIILQMTGNKQRTSRFGIPESEFHLFNGRAKMITKMPIRLITLSMLDLNEKQTFWDVGFCTGSVSIEAKLHFPHLNITAFEIRKEGRELMALNSRKFGTPGINTVIGDFLDTDLSLYPAPDAVFIGGHGGRLEEMINKIHTVMHTGGCIVFNSVSEESRQIFIHSVENVGMSLIASTRIVIDNNNPINILKAQ